MSIVKSFPYSNTTSGVTKNATALGLITNYTGKNVASTKYLLSNGTFSNTAAREVITMASSDVNNISMQQKNYYPPKVGAYKSVTVTDEVLVSLTDDNDPTWREDSPIVVDISVKFSGNGRITAADLEQQILRCLSAFYKDDGTSRLSDFMGGLIQPTAN